MNVYDYAHSLARAIGHSSEHREYRAALKKLEADKSSHEMLLDFRREQLELEKAILTGEEPGGREQKLQKMFEVIRLNSLVSDFLAAEYRFARMMEDIQKILAEAISPEKSNQ
jgi:cell fate (sporulation/competence/biofilm development) regulator YlbF (YheA/YmcA/DUF963 family)